MERSVAETIMAFANSSRQRPTKKEVQALRLADAAPDLLAAAKAIVEVINEGGEWADRGGWLANLEAAIAKATGKEA